MPRKSPTFIARRDHNNFLVQDLYFIDFGKLWGLLTEPPKRNAMLFFQPGISLPLRAKFFIEEMRVLLTLSG